MINSNSNSSSRWRRRGDNMNKKKAEMRDDTEGGDRRQG